MSELFDVVLLPIVLLLLIMFVLIVYFVYDNRTQLFNLNSSLHSYINEDIIKLKNVINTINYNDNILQENQSYISSIINDQHIENPNDTNRDFELPNNNSNSNNITHSSNVSDDDNIIPILEFHNDYLRDYVINDDEPDTDSWNVNKAINLTRDLDALNNDISFTYL